MISKTFLFLALATVCVIVTAQSDFKLPDKKPLALWQEETDYSHSYYVGTNHPLASDENNGTKAAPFKSVGKAATIG